MRFWQRNVLLALVAVLMLAATVDDAFGAVLLFQENPNQNTTDAASGIVFVNYTKPPASGGLSGLWQVKHQDIGTTTTENLTLPAACWNYDAGKLVLRMNSQDQSIVTFECYNSTAWQVVRTVGAGGRCTGSACNGGTGSSPGNLIDANYATFGFWCSNTGVWRQSSSCGDTAYAYEEGIWWTVTNTTLTLRVTDLLTGGLISGFCARITGTGYNGTRCNTTGTEAYLVPFNQTNSSLWLNLTSAQYFNGSAQDQSPNEQQASLNGRGLQHGIFASNGNALNITTGRYGLGFNVTDIRGHVNLSNSGQWDYSDTTSFTWAFWAKFTSCPANDTHEAGLLGRTNNGNNRLTIDIVASTATSACVLRFGFRNNSGTINNPDAPNNIPFDEWFYVTGTYDATTRNASIYMNGIYQNSGTVTATNINISGSQAFLFANRNTINSGNAKDYNGTFDELRIWNRSLSQAEILQEMNSAYPVQGVNLVASYSFELNNITAGAALNTTADTNYLVNGSSEGEGAYYFPGEQSGPDVYLTLDSPVALNDSWTVASWVKINNTGRNSLAGDSNGGSGFIFIRDSVTEIAFEPVTDGRGCVINYGSATFRFDTWKHVAVVANSTNVTAFIDGSYAGSCTPALNDTQFTVQYIGRAYTLIANSYFNGSMAKVRVFSRALSAEEVADLYLNQLPGFGLYNITFYNITGGHAAPSYFNTTNQSVNYTGAMTITGQTYQALLDLAAYRLFLNTGIGSFNATNNNTRNTTSTGSLLIPASNGTNNLKIDVAGNYSLNITCTVTSPVQVVGCNATGIYDNIFKINATDSLGGAQVLEFSARAANGSLGGSLSTVVTSNGSAFLPLLQGYYYQFFITSSEYASTNVTVPANASTNFYQFSLLPGNSIFAYFFDEESLASITQNVTVEFTKGAESFTNTSGDGEMIVQGLDAGTWTLAVSSDGYESRQYFVTVTDGHLQDVDVYLLNSSEAQVTTFTIKDADTADVIPNATVTMQQRVSGNCVTIDQQVTDIFGVARFELVNGKSYCVMVEADGYATKEGEFTVTTTSYIIVLGSANTQNFITYGQEFEYAILPEEVENNETTFSITVSSDVGALDWFAVAVTLNGTTTLQNVTGSPSGGTASVTLNLTGYNRQYVTATYYVKSASFSDALVISRSWYILGFEEGEYTLSAFMRYYADDDNGLGTVSRGIIATIGATVLGALLGFIFGTGAAILGASVAFIAAAFYGWIHWTIIAVVVGGLLGALFLTGRGR